MKQANNDLAAKKRYPESVVLIICKDKKGMVDITPIGWFMVCDKKPRCWAISLHHKHYSTKVISETKEFVLCLPSYSQKKDLLYCGTVSGWKVDKLKKTKFKIMPSKKVKAPILSNSIACFECKVINKIKAPNHTIFIGETLISHVSARKDKLYTSASHNLFKWTIK